MKLAFIEIAGFRGFKDKARFDLPGGFVVLTGRNGVGKSTVLDAVDFALTGTINKYAVKEAKGGGLEDHIWWVGEGEPESQYVTVGFIDENGEDFVITRSREQGVHTPIDEFAQRLCFAGSSSNAWAEALMQTTLIRDETIASLSLDLPEQARFAAVRAAISGLAGPDHTTRTGALLSKASTAKTAQERRVGDAQAELGRALSSLTEARSLAERQTDVTEAEEIIQTLAPHLIGAPGEHVEGLRRHIVDRKQTNSSLAEALSRVEALQSERNNLESDIALAEVETARANQAAARRAKERAEEMLVDAKRLEAAERESDAFASHMVTLLDHGEAVGLQAGHCPLCDAVRSSDEFATAIEAARSKLTARGSGAARAATAIEQAHLAVEHAEAALALAEQKINELEARRSRISREAESLASTFAELHIAASPSEPQSVRGELLQRQEETASLEQALFILEASNAHDRVTVLERRVVTLREQVNQETARLTASRRALEKAKELMTPRERFPTRF